MSDIRSRKKTQSAKMINDLSFEVVRDIVFVGHNVKLSFSYDLNANPSVVGFKIYKAVLPQPKLKKNYVIDQRALQRISSIKSFSTQNTLYNKSLFSQNSQLKFKDSNSNKHDKNTGNISSYSFMDAAFVRSEFHKFSPEKNVKKYFWTDRNVKFGETYAYYVTALTSDFYETPPAPIQVSVENLKHPNPPNIFQVQETDRGLLLIFGNNQDRNISKFKIYKREDSESGFQFFADVDNDNEMIHFSDLDIIPKRHYIYQIFSEDIFGGISLSSIERSGTFRYTSPTRNLEHQPSVYIDSLNEQVRIRVKNNRPDKVSSVRIERRDDWRFERDFNSKDFNGVHWENNIFFDKDDLVDFLDKTTHQSRTYSYRITSFTKMGHVVSYYLTPPLKPGEIHKLDNIQAPISVKPKIITFNTEVVNEQQNPVFVKASWNIFGDWSYLIVNTGQDKIRIDNLHKVVFLSDFRRGNKYVLNVELYDMTGKKADEYKNIVINL